jgi:hypothetical protein
MSAAAKTIAALTQNGQILTNSQIKYAPSLYKGSLNVR